MCDASGPKTKCLSNVMIFSEYGIEESPRCRDDNDDDNDESFEQSF